MSSSFLRDFYRRYYGKEMLQRALCLSTVHRKKPYNNSGSFEKRKRGGNRFESDTGSLLFFINQERGILRRWSEI